MDSALPSGLMTRCPTTRAADVFCSNGRGAASRLVLVTIALLGKCDHAVAANGGGLGVTSGLPQWWPSCTTDSSCLFDSTELRLFVGRPYRRSSSSSSGGSSSSSSSSTEAGEDTILLSVVSYVFNVTKGPQYYRKGLGSYDYLAGTEASRSLAKMSSQPEDVGNHSLVDLDEEEWEELFNWIDKYQEKYPLVGRLVDWKPGVTIEDINERSGFTLRPAPVRPDAGVGRVAAGPAASGASTEL
eukprot:TRINITY_DN10889_c0_g3_i1.p1 TRINITY_DN10889_c0_g3~~TRINITY_DN10889_c0_g3_i1.p1  ORF type:complete len:243 (-),score=43.89 TRINITY_DN10889_c0_g3_i1:40-768(-)